MNVEERDALLRRLSESAESWAIAVDGAWLSGLENAVFQHSLEQSTRDKLSVSWAVAEAVKSVTELRKARKEATR